jgi:xanthine dehydrogenase YagR molybdenum-binding subunit
VHLNRFAGAYDAGRIINPKTARSQALDGIIWGVGQALLEQSETDPVLGRFLNRNYSGYLVPTNADIPKLDVLFVGEFDGEASPLGAKGLGELTAVSVAPAIANAVFHAPGRRVRPADPRRSPALTLRTAPPSERKPGSLRKRSASG